MKNFIGICVGHSRKIKGRPEGGAITHDGESNEWKFNSALAQDISKYLDDRGVPNVVIDSYQGEGYGSAQRWLADFLKKANVTLAIELHFNSADVVTANGHEWLYWHSSENGKRIAQNLEREFASADIGLNSRGAKALTSYSRGAEFVKGTHCPAVICEPFFGSSPKDWKIAKTQRSKIVEAIGNGILKSVKI